MNDVLDLVYPPRCAGCDAPGASFCTACRASLRAAVLPRPRHVREAVALGRFEGPLRRAIHRLKYRGEAVVADAVGAELGALVARGLALGWRADAIVPVPLARRRRRERGFDQAALLGRAAARSSGLPVRSCLRRTRATRSQVGLGRADRAANVHGAFSAASVPSRVVLVDDVATTGATLGECARALRAAGAREVRAVVAAVET